VVCGAEMTMDIWLPQVVFFGNVQSSDAQEITGILGDRNFHCHFHKIHFHAQLRRSVYTPFCLPL